MVAAPDRTVVLTDGREMAGACYYLLSVEYEGVTHFNRLTDESKGIKAVNPSEALRSRDYGVVVGGNIPSPPLQGGRGPDVKLDPCFMLRPGVRTVTWQWSGPYGTAWRSEASTTISIFADPAPSVEVSYAGSVGQPIWRVRAPRAGGSIAKWEYRVKDVARGSGYGPWTKLAGGPTQHSAWGMVNIPGLAPWTEYDVQIRFHTTLGASQPWEMRWVIAPSDPLPVAVAPVQLALIQGQLHGYSPTYPSPPKNAVVITPVSSAPASVAVSGPLTFTPENWQTPQRVSVTARQDYDASAESATITHQAAGNHFPPPAYPFATPQQGYRVAASPVSVAARDTYAPRIQLTPASLTMDEFDQATYTLALGAQPAGNVIVTPVSSDATAVTVSGPLTFTPENWQTPQGVAAISAPDRDFTDDSATITHTVAGKPILGSVSVLVRDRRPTFSLPEKPADTTAGADIKLKVHSNRTLAGEHIVNLHFSRGGEHIVAKADYRADFGKAGSVAAIYIGTKGWRVPQEKSGSKRHYDVRLLTGHYIVGKPSLIASGRIVPTLSESSRGIPAGLAATAAEDQVALTWKRPADFNKDIHAWQYVFVVPNRRCANSLSLSNKAHGSFENAGSSDGTHTHTIDTSTFPHSAIYRLCLRVMVRDGVTGVIEFPRHWSEPVSVQIVNADQLALTLSRSTLSVAGDGAVSFTVVPATGYFGTVTLTSSDENKATVSPGELTFTRENAAVPQEVVVTGVVTGSATINLAFNIRDGVLHLPEAAQVAVSVSRPKTLQVSPPRLTVAEGGSAIYTVQLGAAPAGKVVVTPFSSRPATS